MHFNRTLDHGDWQPMMNDLPNSFDANSYNPYDNPEKEKLWRSSKHVGTGIPQPPTQNYQAEIETAIKPAQVINENSESVQDASSIVPAPSSNKISIRLGGDIFQKRNFSSSFKNTDEEVTEPKGKRQKHL